MRILLIAVLSLTAWAQTARWPDNVAGPSDIPVGADAAISTLAGGINNSTTSVAVADASRFRQYQMVRVDSERMLITAIGAGSSAYTASITISTGSFAISAATHGQGNCPVVAAWDSSGVAVSSGIAVDNPGSDGDITITGSNGTYYVLVTAGAYCPAITISTGSFAITEATHGQGDWPLVTLYSSGVAVAASVALDSPGTNGNLTITAPNGSYTVAIEASGYNAALTVSGGTATITGATHGRGTWPRVVLYSSGTAVSSGVTLTSPATNGNLTITATDGTYRVAVLGDPGSSNTLTVVRGYDSSSAASHSSGAIVRGEFFSRPANQLRAEVLAIEAWLAEQTFGSGANANGYYIVSRSTNAPTNAQNLGALGSGVLKHTVSGGVSTVSVVSGTGSDCVKVDGTSGACGTGGGGGSYTAGPSGAIDNDLLETGVVDIDTAVVCRKGDACAPTGLQDWSGSAGIIAKSGTMGATCAAGTVLYDANYVHVCTSTNTPKKAPLTALIGVDTTISWTSRNAGTSTLTTGATSLMLYRPNSNGGGPIWTGRELTMPTPPYTVTAKMIGVTPTDWGASSQGYGLYIADNSTGRVQQFHYAPNTTSIYRTNLDNAYALDAQTALEAITLNGVVPIQWFRITDNGTNIAVSISLNGDIWWQVGSASRTGWTAAPNRIGWFVSGGNGNYSGRLILDYWKVE